MDWYRIKHTIGMHLKITAIKRATYIKKHNIFYRIGEGCMVMFRKIPLYPKLISFGDNVWIASNVTFITHDVIHRMINKKNGAYLNEHIGCIEIKDNCFIGSNTTILPNVSIGPNTIVGAGTVVNKSLKDGVYAGVPAKYICSVDEFLSKRSYEEQVNIKRDKGNLSYETIESCWDKFKKYENM